jgi:hypothetical protein
MMSDARVTEAPVRGVGNGGRFVSMSTHRFLATHRHTKGLLEPYAIYEADLPTSFRWSPSRPAASSRATETMIGNHPEAQGNHPEGMVTAARRTAATFFSRSGAGSFSDGR